MVGLKLRKLSATYGSTPESWARFQDEAQEVVDEARSQANTPLMSRTTGGSASELRKQLNDERASRERSFNKLLEVNKIEDDAERGKALTQYLKMAVPKMQMPEEGHPAQLVTDATDSDLILSLFKGLANGAPESNNRVQLMEQLACNLKKSKKGEEKEVGSLLANALAGSRRLQEAGMPDLISDIARSAVEDYEKWKNWELMMWCIDDWLRRMRVTKMHAYVANNNRIWISFQEAMAAVGHKVMGNFWDLLKGPGNRVSAKLPFVAAKMTSL